MQQKLKRILKLQILANACLYVNLQLTSMQLRKELMSSFKALSGKDQVSAEARLFEFVGVKETWKPKNVPAHSHILEIQDC